MEIKKCFSIFVISVLCQILFIIAFYHKADKSAQGAVKRAQQALESNTSKAKVNSSSTIIPEIPKDTSLLIVINTVPSKFERRQTLRETWAKRTSLAITPTSPSSKQLEKMVIAYFFSVGFDGHSSVDTAIKSEADVQKDILRLDMNETYRGITQKVLRTFQWVANLSLSLNHGIEPRFIVKADDDVYIKVPDLAKWLLENAVQPDKRLYAGFVHRGVKVIRSPESPWYVSSEEYKNDYFPDYCAGPFYVLTRNVFLDVLHAFKVTKLFPVEDAYMGVLMNKIGAKPLRTGLSLFNWNRHTNSLVLAGKQGIPAGTVLGDSLNSEAIRTLHRIHGNITDSQST